MIEQPTGPRPTRSRRGVILIAVLIALVVLTLAGYQYADMMTSEYRAADNVHRQAQARALAESGIHYAAALLASPDNVNNLLAGNIYDNAQYFRDIQIPTSDGSGQFGKFSLIAPPSENAQNGSSGVRYGVTDEGAKLNLNVLMQLDPTGTRLYNALMLLPNMTADIANAIVDWLDPDTTAREGGAEDDYYMSLSPPYHAKNGPLESLEELLLVKGVSPQLLFGNDVNRNGIIDPGEDDGSGSAALGWSAYLTVYSREQNSDPSGNAYIYLNSSDLQTLYQNLTTAVDDSTATFVILFLQYGSSTGGTGAAPMGSGSPTAPQGNQNTMSQGNQNSNQQQTAKPSSNNQQQTAKPSSNNQQSAQNTSKPTSQQNQNGNSNANVQQNQNKNNSSNNAMTPGNANTGPVQGDLTSAQLDFTKPLKSKIKSIWQLVGNVQVTVPASGQNQPAVIYTSPFNDPGNQATLLPLLFSSATVSQANEVPARINVNTATQEVVSTIQGMVPELQDTDIQAIMANQPPLTSGEAPDPSYQTPAWLLTKANLSVSTLQKLDRYITTRSQVYRVQSVGYFDDRTAAARVEAIIDTNGGRPRIIAFRDLSALGKGLVNSGQ